MNASDYLRTVSETVSRVGHHGVNEFIEAAMLANGASEADALDKAYRAKCLIKDGLSKFGKISPYKFNEAAATEYALLVAASNKVIGCDDPGHFSRLMTEVSHAKARYRSAGLSKKNPVDGIVEELRNRWNAVRLGRTPEKISATLSTYLNEQIRFNFLDDAYTSFIARRML